MCKLDFAFWEPFLKWGCFKPSSKQFQFPCVGLCNGNKLCKCLAQCWLNWPYRWPGFLHHAWVAPSNGLLPLLAWPRWLLALSTLYSDFTHSLVLIQGWMGLERMFDGLLLPWANHHLCLVWVRGIPPLSWDATHACSYKDLGLLPPTSQSSQLCRNLSGTAFPKH